LDKDTADAYADYLKRSYEKHWNKDGDIQSNSNTGVKQIIARGKEVKSENADEILEFANEALRKNGKPEVVNPMDISDIKDHLQNEGMLGTSIVDGKVVWKENGNEVTLKRDWTKAERESMGEIENASVTLPNTLLSMGMMIENAKLMQEFTHHTKGFKDVEEARFHGYEQIPNTKRYGNLAGLYVERTVADQLKYSFENIGEFYKLYQQFTSVWKQGKTVFNPASHANNFIGNTTTAFMMGRTTKEAFEILARMTDMAKDFPTKIGRFEELRKNEFIANLNPKEIAEYNQLKTELKYYIEGKENGLFGRGQIQDLLKGFDATTNAFKEKGTITKGVEAVQRAYQRGDDIPRLASYVIFREKGMGIKEAKTYTNDHFPDYTKPLPPLFRKLRDSGFSPFIAWSYYVLPNIFKRVKEHPLRASGVLTVAYLAFYLASGINPFGDEMPDKEKGRRVPISEDGTTLKVDRMIPAFDFAAVPMDMANQLIQGIAKGRTGEGVSKAVSAGARDTGKLAQDYLFGGLPKALVELINDKSFYSGRSISGDSKSADKQAYNVAKYIAGTLAPAPLANVGGLAENAINPKLKKKHSEVVPRTNTQELLKMLGLNTMTYDTNKVKRNRLLEQRKYDK